MVQVQVQSKPQSSLDEVNWRIGLDGIKCKCWGLVASGVAGRF